MALIGKIPLDQGADKYFMANPLSDSYPLSGDR
jgi:hypothetical protein